MKVLHICTTDVPGAATAVDRLHLGLKSKGVDSKILRLYGSSQEEDVVQFKGYKNSFEALVKRIRNKFISLELNAYRARRPKGYDLFSDDRTPYRVSEHPAVKEADIINLHWIAWMVDYNEFFLNIANKAVVWTLHDRNPITGGCHVPGECTKYQTGCGLCPQLGSNDPNDLSRRIFQRKEKAYKGHNISIVAPSKELMNCVKKSLLFENFEIYNIPHGLSKDVFKKRDKNFVRGALNLPEDKTLVLFGGYYLSKNKGFEYLLGALKLLGEKIDIHKVALVTFGPKQELDAVSKNIGISIYQLGYIKDQDSLAAVYSSCDMLLIPSQEEAFGQTCLESMACATPPIAFNTGGMLDMIIPQETGLLAELKNTKDLAQKIEYLMTHPKEREEMGRNASKRIEEEYTLEIQAKRYLNLYEKCLS